MIYYGKSPDIKSEKALESDKLGFKALSGLVPQISYSAAPAAHKTEIITHALKPHFVS